MFQLNVWVEAARPRTLTAAIVPVAVGTVCADTIVPWRAAAALVASISIQIAVNFANDLFDAQRGIDTEQRVGPRRATSSGLVTARQMRIAMFLALTIAAAAGSALAIAVGPELWIVGALCVLAMLGYSGGPRPYASLGLGEVFVFVFFGLVATVGSTYVHSEEIELLPVLAAIPVGLLAVAILVVNNLRDIETDSAAGKRTLSVRMGATASRAMYRLCLAVSFLAIFPVAWAADSRWVGLALLAAPLALIIDRMVQKGSGAALLPALGATARLQLAFGVLLTVGLWIAR